jgi:hypothetical protein
MKDYVLDTILYKLYVHVLLVCKNISLKCNKMLMKMLTVPE